MCLFPRLIHNPKYKATKKNGGVIPPIFDERVKFVPIGCGKCLECKKQKATMWGIRLQEDIRHNKNAKFVTLTFSPDSLFELTLKVKEKEISEGYDLDNDICTYAVRYFLERLRKETKKSVRHFFISELGGKNTEGVHLHGFIWTDDLESVLKHWKYGLYHVGKYVNEKTINYVIKYITKSDINHRNYNPVILCSKGIGADYTKREDFKKHKYKKGETIETYKTRQGKDLNLPIYYRNKAFSEEERERLWIEKLDKQVRYVLGMKIDVKEGHEKYFKILEMAQTRNNMLGYGGQQLDWEQERYEKERRRMKQAEKIAKRLKK